MHEQCTSCWQGCCRFLCLPESECMLQRDNVWGLARSHDVQVCRYAGPPTGNLLFKNVVVLNSTSCVNSTKCSPTCLQYGYFDGNAYGMVSVNWCWSLPLRINLWSSSPSQCFQPRSLAGQRHLEDCLYRNIYIYIYRQFLHSNASSAVPGNPVMVWYYGGGDPQGSASNSTFDGVTLTSRADLAVMTINVKSRSSSWSESWSNSDSTDSTSSTLLPSSTVWSMATKWGQTRSSPCVGST